MITSCNHIFVYKGEEKLHIIENCQVDTWEGMNENTTNAGVDCDDIWPKDDIIGAKS